MKNNRRNFLKQTGLAGIGVASSGILGGFTKEPYEKIERPNFNNSGIQQFNMCGYAAPKMETVRVGFIGLGARGPGHVLNLTKLEGVEVVGLCDIIPESVLKVKKSIE